MILWCGYTMLLYYDTVRLHDAVYTMLQRPPWSDPSLRLRENDFASCFCSFRLAVCLPMRMMDSIGRACMRRHHSEPRSVCQKNHMPKHIATHLRRFRDVMSSWLLHCLCIAVEKSTLRNACHLNACQTDALIPAGSQGPSSHKKIFAASFCAL